MNLKQMPSCRCKQLPASYKPAKEKNTIDFTVNLVCYMIHLMRSLAQVMSVSVANNSPSQDVVSLDNPNRCTLIVL